MEQPLPWFWIILAVYLAGIPITFWFIVWVYRALKWTTTKYEAKTIPAVLIVWPLSILVLGCGLLNEWIVESFKRLVGEEE